MVEASETDLEFLRIAYEEALSGYKEGGCPIGSVLARGDTLISQGRNQRVQQGDPIAHGEMDCLRKAGRQSIQAVDAFIPKSEQSSPSFGSDAANFFIEDPSCPPSRGSDTKKSNSTLITT